MYTDVWASYKFIFPLETTLTFTAQVTNQETASCNSLKMEMDARTALIWEARCKELCKKGANTVWYFPRLCSNILQLLNHIMSLVFPSLFNPLLISCGFTELCVLLHMFLPCLLLPPTGLSVWAGELWAFICSLFTSSQFYRSFLQCTLSRTLDIRLVISVVLCNGNHSEKGFRQLL